MREAWGGRGGGSGQGGRLTTRVSVAWSVMICYKGGYKGRLQGVVARDDEGGYDGCLRGAGGGMVCGRRAAAQRQAGTTCHAKNATPLRMILADPRSAA